MIRFDHVTRTYEVSGRPALDDVSVEFDRGDFVFLIGASGSGKSTLLRMILREGLPQRGKVTVAGQNLGLMLEGRVPVYRRSIGMVFQDFRLLPEKNVYDNVAFAMKVLGAKRNEIRDRVANVLERVEIDHLAKRYPHEISGGEQQRAAIARAVVNEPSILLADEPTGNLDPRASEEVMKVLRRINTSGTTVVMATHDRVIVDRGHKRVVQLRDGAVVRDEPRGLYEPPNGSITWQPELAESDPADSAHVESSQSDSAHTQPADTASAHTESVHTESTQPASADSPVAKPVVRGTAVDAPVLGGAAANEEVTVSWPKKPQESPAHGEASIEQRFDGLDGSEIPEPEQDDFSFAAEAEHRDETIEAGPLEEPVDAEHRDEPVDAGPLKEPANSDHGEDAAEFTSEEDSKTVSDDVAPAGSDQDDTPEQTRGVETGAASGADKVPPPRSSVSQTSYSDTRRTAEQLGVRPAKRSLLSRLRRDS